MGRFSVLEEIQSLDPERDHVRIQFLSTGFEFSWDTTRALEVALYRTYCVPSISSLLDRTGEFHHRPQRRYDDTALIIAEMLEWGYEHGRGREALEKMNWAHGHYQISNDDYLYVLSTFVFEPIRWNDRYGWRKMCEKEKLASYFFWREVGSRMGIRDIPPTYNAFEEFSLEYERQRFRFADSNRAIGTRTRDLFASWFPRFFAPVVYYSIYALLDDNVLEAFRFPRPLPVVRGIVRGALRLRSRIVRFLPPRTKAHFVTHDWNRTYPHGYTISEMGPPPLLERSKKQLRSVPGL